MPRKPRIHFPGALYHVMLRGNRGGDVFADDRDRFRFFLLVQEIVERLEGQVFAYCLMDNHIHLALQVGNVSLSKIMQNLSSRYTRWSNWRHQKTGHLFQGRYKAILVDADAYLLQLVAYLHLNPVRAGMTAKPEDYPWSSYRAYLGMEVIPWLRCDLVLGQFSREVSAARKAFVDFVAGETDKGRREEFHGVGSSDPRLCGEEDFQSGVLRRVDELSAVRPDLLATVSCVANFFGIGIEELKSPGQERRLSRVRAFAAWAVGGYSTSTLTALGAMLARDVSTLSSAARRLEREGRRSENLARVKAELATKLTNLQT